MFLTLYLMDISMKLTLNIHYTLREQSIDNETRVHHCMSRNDLLDGVNQGCLFGIRQDVIDADDTGVFGSVRSRILRYSGSSNRSNLDNLFVRMNLPSDKKIWQYGQIQIYPACVIIQSTFCIYRDPVHQILYKLRHMDLHVCYYKITRDIHIFITG